MGVRVARKNGPRGKREGPMNTGQDRRWRSVARAAGIPFERILESTHSPWPGRA
jgi:hypothetical protein